MGSILTSWKEIAAYLGKGVRTVQRWEQTFGLPIRRPDKGNAKTVLANTTELDEWIQTTTARPVETTHGEITSLRLECQQLRQEVAALRARCVELESRVISPKIVEPTPLYRNARRG